MQFTSYAPRYSERYAVLGTRSVVYRRSLRDTRSSQPPDRCDTRHWLNRSKLVCRVCFPTSANLIFPDHGDETVNIYSFVTYTDYTDTQYTASYTETYAAHSVAALNPTCLHMDMDIVTYNCASYKYIFLVIRNHVRMCVCVYVCMQIADALCTCA